MSEAEKNELRKSQILVLFLFIYFYSVCFYNILQGSIIKERFLFELPKVIYVYNYGLNVFVIYWLYDMTLLIVIIIKSRYLWLQTNKSGFKAILLVAYIRFFYQLFRLLIEIIYP